jgi:hypothetical protein
MAPAYHAPSRTAAAAATKLAILSDVIPYPRGWTKSYSGDAITFYHPEGPAVGAIRYRERVRPLLPARLIVERLHARTPQFQVASVARPEMIVTSEGEYGAYVTVAGAYDGRAAHRAVGMVFGDDFYALLSGLCAAPDRVPEFTRLFRLLLHADSHALGIRRRRYLYAPPPGWHGQMRGFTTEWSPLDFPRALSLIHVYPANPVAVEPQLVLDQMLADDQAGGFVLEGVRGPQPVSSAHGLGGQMWNISGRFGAKPLADRDLVVFKDAHFLYSLRFESMEEDRAAPRRLFHDVVRSVHPIPTGSTLETKQVDNLVGHWAL